jgi:hypothetical protein
VVRQKGGDDVSNVHCLRYIQGSLQMCSHSLFCIEQAGAVKGGAHNTSGMHVRPDNECSVCGNNDKPGCV